MSTKNHSGNGKKTYEILDDFRLSDPKKLGKKIKELDSGTLNALYNALKEYYDANSTSLFKEIQKSDIFKIYPSQIVSYSFRSNYLRAMCLYCDKFIIWDPIYGILRGLETGTNQEAIIQQLSYRLPDFLAIRELAEYNILTLVPHSLRSKNALQLQLDEEARNDSQAEGFRKICMNNMEIGVDRGEVKEGCPYSLISIRLGFNSPSRFGLQWSGTIPPKTMHGLSMGPGRPFKLETPEKVIELKPKRISLDTAKTDEEIKKVIDSNIFLFAQELNADLLFSEVFDANYFTNFDVDWQLLNWKLKSQHEKPNNKAKLIPSLLTLDLKFLDNIPYDKILKIRESESATFEDFRFAFKKACEDIKSLPRTKEFVREVKNIEEEKIAPELRKLDREFDTIKKYRLIRSLPGGIVATGSIVGTIFTGSPLFISTVIGGSVASLREYAEYFKEKSSLKKNSMYFLWRIKRG